MNPTTPGAAELQQYRQGYQAGQAARHAALQPRDRDTAPPAWLRGHGAGAEHAALVLAAAALRLLTACEHGEDLPGTCPECEPLEPLVYVAMRALPLLCPTAEDPAALRQALQVAETVTRAHDGRDLSSIAAALRRATAA